ncbi:hypothetical protein Q7O_003657 [Pectobacterium carotovorum subsp. carotovorum PCCS1]|nr:hypothetical protein [Pectobacterium carotovorum subsp. carotovorum PCCS1]
MVTCIEMSVRDVQPLKTNRFSPERQTLTGIEVMLYPKTVID